MPTSPQQIANELYDLIRICALPKRQDDEYATLSKIHAKEATAFFKKYLHNKEISVNGNRVALGKRITITITQQ